MVGFIIICIILFFLFQFIGAIKGFTASKEARALRKELTLVQRKLSALEKRVRSAAPTTDQQSVSAPEQSTQPEARKFASAVDHPLIPDTVEEQHIVSTDAVMEKSATLAPTDAPETTATDENATVAPPSPTPSPVAHSALPKPRPKRKVRRKPEPRPKSKWAQQFEGMNWETLIGTYIVPRLGVLGITIAVFILLALAAQNLGPAFRVALGYGVSAALFGIGKFTERKHPTYSRVVYGACLAVAYFVTFATHYVPFARIFESPLPSLGGMAVIVGIWAFIAQRRKSPTIAMLTTALGHFTIGLTSVTVDNPGIYSVFGIVLLSLGCAFFMLKNRWYYVAAAGMCASYVNHFLLLAMSKGTGTVSEFTIGMGVLSTYFAIFALSELFAPEELRRGGIPSVVRSLYVTVNSACFFLIGALLMESYEFTEDRQHLFEYALAAALLAICVLYFLRRKQDPMYNTYFAKAVTVATVGMAVQFDGHTLTVALAIETVALLFSSRRSGLVVTRLFAHLVGGLTFLHGMYTFLEMQYVPYADEAFRVTLLQSILPPVALLAGSLAYQRIDWSSRMRLGFRMPKGLQTPLWMLDLHPEPAEGAKAPKKPFDGLLFPYAYAMAGGILWLSYTMRLIEMVDRFNVYGCLALGLLGLAWAVKSRPFAALSVLFTATTFIMTWHTMVEPKFYSAYLIGVIALILIALATEEKWLPDRDALSLQRNRVAPYVFYGVAAWSAGLYLTFWFTQMSFLGALLAGCVVLSALTLVLHKQALATYATGYLVWAYAGWMIETVDIFSGSGVTLSSGQNTVAVAMFVVAVAGDRFYTMRKLPIAGCIFLCVAFVTSTRFAGMHIDDQWYGFILALIAAAFLGYGAVLRSRTALALALGGTAYAALMQLNWAYDGGREYALAPTVLGFGSVILLLIVYERAAHIRFSNTLGKALGPVTGTCVAFAALLGVIMLERIPGLAAFYLTLSWSILALGYFAVAVGTREKAYRFAALAILSLAIIRVVFVDTRELEAVARVFAFGGLGAVLLGIGLGYVKAFGQDSNSPKSAVLPTEEAIDETRPGEQAGEEVE